MARAPALSSAPLQLRRDVVAPLLAVLLPGQLLRRDGVDPPLRQEQGLLPRQGEGPRRRGVLPEQRVGHPEEGLAVAVQAPGADHGIAALRPAPAGRWPGCSQDGIAHHRASVPADLGVGRIREIGGILKAGVPVLSRLWRVAGEEDPVLRAAHTVNSEDPCSGRSCLRTPPGPCGP